MTFQEAVRWHTAIVQSPVRMRDCFSREYHAMLKLWHLTVQQEVKAPDASILTEPPWVHCICEHPAEVAKHAEGHIKGIHPVQVWRFILEREVEAPERFQVGSSSLNPKVLTLKQLLSSVNCP